MYHSVNALQTILKTLSTAVSSLQTSQAQLQQQLQAIEAQLQVLPKSAPLLEEPASGDWVHAELQRLDDEVNRLRSQLGASVKLCLETDAGVIAAVDTLVLRCLDSNLSIPTLSHPCDGTETGLRGSTLDHDVEDLLSPGSSCPPAPEAAGKKSGGRKKK
jgi:hypothetical protein